MLLPSISLKEPPLNLGDRHIQQCQQVAEEVLQDERDSCLDCS